jgi:hypothetical protein
MRMILTSDAIRERYLDHTSESFFVMLSDIFKYRNYHVRRYHGKIYMRDVLPY